MQFNFVIFCHTTDFGTELVVYIDLATMNTFDQSFAGVGKRGIMNNIGLVLTFMYTFCFLSSKILTFYNLFMYNL